MIAGLMHSAGPTSEAHLIDFLRARSLHVAVESRALNGTQISYDFEALRTPFTGQCHFDGSSIKVISTFGGTRTVVESHLELYKSDLIRGWGEPLQEEGMANAPRLAWHRPKRTLTLDAFWSVPEFSVLMLAVELKHTDSPGS